MERRIGHSVRERRRLVNALTPNRACLGRLGERLALAVYYLEGYRPVRRPRRERVQTDILVQRGCVLVLVEVKTRRRAEPLAKVLGPAQKQRLARQVAFWAARRPHLTVRLDVVEICAQWPWWRRWKNILV